MRLRLALGLIGLIFILVLSLSNQGCSSSSGGGVAPVGSGSNAPVPSGIKTVLNDVGLPGTASNFPAPWSNSLYAVPRSGYANVSSGTICAHPDNGWNVWLTAIQSTDTDVNGDLQNGVVYVQFLEVYYRNSPGGPRVTAQRQDFSIDKNISGARWAHPNGVWFGQQVTGNYNVFRVVDPYGVQLHTGATPDNALHIWQNPVSSTPFRRVKIPTSASVIGIQGRFYVLNGALAHIGLDRTPTNTSTDSSTFAQEIISQSYDDGGFGTTQLVDISIESGVTWVDSADPNPPIVNPNFGQVTPITHAVFGGP